MKTLQQIRKQLGFNQEDIAKKLKISQQSYAQYEKQQEKLSYKLAIKIAEILSINVEDIYFKEDMTGTSIGEFLEKSFTSFHAVNNASKILLENGFYELKEDQKWELIEGGKYFIKRNSSALIAFKVNDLSDFYFNIALSHSDSPCLKVKGNSLLPSKEGKRINIEKYGGLINYSFLDIPLKVAGRVFINKDNKLMERLVTSDYTINIPSLCIHHNPTVNQGTELKYQSDMLPLVGDIDDLYKSLLPNEDIVDADLYCVPYVKPQYIGVNKELLSSPRIDNLSSLYCSIFGLLESKDKGVSIIYASDNEEIGSLTKQGADSNFLLETIYRIGHSFNKTDEEICIAKSKGFILSIDNGHAIHQSNNAKNDPDIVTTLNGGVTIKHHVNYATDGYSSSLIKLIAKQNDIKIQDYYNNSDVRCGSTVGPMTSAKLGMNTCDIGLAQLAMHSAIETVGKLDIERLTKLISCFFNRIVD